MEKYIFVSYSRKNSSAVEPFVKELRNAGYDVRFDKEDIPPGAKWKDVLADFAQNCTVCLAFHSAMSSKSEHCQVELNRASEFGHTIISVYLEDNVQLVGGLAMYIKPLQELYMRDYKDYSSLLKKLETSKEFSACKTKPVQIHSSDTEKVPVRECKVIFLGPGGAGKSSLITKIHSSKGQSLLLEGYDMIMGKGTSDDAALEYPTEGALLSEWGTVIEGNDYRLRLLEFGGQQILWPMHNLLLTHKTVYVVVCDSGDASEEQLHLEQSAKLWLRTVNWYAPDCPVILVFNKIDKNEKPSVNRAELRKIIPGLEFYNTSATTCEGIDELIEAISRAVKKCPYDFDADVSGIEFELERKRSDNHITYGEYQGICEKYHICGRNRQDSLLNMLTSIGAICYYPTPENWIVTNPNWLTNGIYRIITDQHHPKDCENGFSKTAYLCALLEKPAPFGLLPTMSYRLGEAHYIIHIMRMLHVSHEVEHDLDMIPPKLNDTPPEKKYAEFQSRYKNTAIHLRWTADFLPDNLMYLIAAHANLKADHHFIWKRGGWFSGNWCEAMVKMSDDHTKLDAYAWPLGSSILRTHREYMDKLRSVIVEVIAGELTRRRKQDIIVEEALFWQDQYVQDIDDEEIFLRRVIDHLHSGMEEIHLDKFNRSVSIRDLLYKTYLNPEEIINNYQNYRAKLSGGL